MDAARRTLASVRFDDGVPREYSFCNPANVLTEKLTVVETETLKGMK